MVKPLRALAVITVASLAVAACGGGSGGSGGDGSKTLIISTDLPMQGASADQSTSTVNAIKLYLEQQGNKAGNYTVKLQPYDDSTAAAGQYDVATCAKNAQDHVANADEVAVMGTLNSTCAKLEVPVLNQDPNGPMLMVSHANTNPGLTKTWDPGEPAKYAPSGKKSYARVVTTDDYQGAADAAFAAQDLGAKTAYVLNDNTTYGVGVAKVFAQAAAKEGMKVAGNEPFDPAAPNYTALFQKIKGTGADFVFVGSTYATGNGGQMLKDKVGVLGDNKTVKFMVPDGWSGIADFLAQPESEGVYVSFAGLGLDPLKAAGGAGAKFIADFNTKYGKDPDSAYPLYGVAAIQVIMAAIAKSDGTRKGIRDAVFEGSGITIPKDQSIIGKELTIDPATGDANAKDISIDIVEKNVEKFLKAQPVVG